MYSMGILRNAGVGFLLAVPAFAAIHERSTATNWKRVATPTDDTPITLKIGLREENLDQLEALIYAVSTPGSSEYGKYMEGNQIEELLHPSQLSESAVTSWLEEAGIEDFSSDGHWVIFTTNVTTANELLDTEFNYYEVNGVQKLRTNGYSVPNELGRFVDLIVPTTYFGQPAQMAPLLPRQVGSRPAPYANTSCTEFVTPQCLHQMYNIPSNYTPSSGSQSKVAFTNYFNQSARANDLYMFEDAYGIPRQGFSVEFVNNGTQTQEMSIFEDISGEANLDIQMLVGVAPGLEVISYNVGGSAPVVFDNWDTVESPESQAWLETFQHILSKSNSEIPQVISNSYGDSEQSIPPAYARRVCNMIGQLGLRGVSVLVASGDSGLGPSCETNNDSTPDPRFTPTFPSSCPYITSVGGTQSVFPEIAWNASGGGFSDYFPQPEYQKTWISEYLTNQVAPENLDYLDQYFNPRGRAYPDIAAHALHPYISIFNNDARSQSGGTSAAAPIVGAMIGLLNDIRIGQGKPTLGFLNPWLYSSGFQSLADIVEGGTGGCEGLDYQSGQKIKGAPIIPFARWNATVGWDPVTGLGIPDFGKMREAVLAL